MRSLIKIGSLLLVSSFILSGCGAHQKPQASQTTQPSSHPASKTNKTNKKPIAQNSTLSKTETKGTTNVSPPPKPQTDPVTSLTNKKWEQLLAKNNFKGPSDGPYPVLKKGENVWIDANVTKERIKIMKGTKILYTMLTSSGIDTSPDTSTPLGTYYIQAEKGATFYSPSEKEGANYWTSWKNHGEFLFHTIPIDKNGNYIMTEAAKLGQPASHGCFRLAINDAKWIYNNIPEGTKVVIHT